MGRYIKGMVSVIIPFYNSEKFIAKAIESVINQDYNNIEIILVNDSSTDGSEQIVLWYEKNFDYIKLVNMSSNVGVAKARNEGIKNASGQYIAFLDSDDIWILGKLETQLKLFEKYERVPFTYTAINFIDEYGNEIKGKRNVPSDVDFNFLKRNTVVATSTVIIDRFVVDNVEMPLRKTAEDYSLWLKILFEYGTAYGLNHVYTSYRKTSTSISSNKIKEIKPFFDVQVKDIGINKFEAVINCFFYIYNALKKHMFK